FLVWIYLAWVSVLLGAVIAAYAPSLQMRVKRWPDGPGAKLQLALAVMRALLHPDHRSVAALGQPLPQALGCLRRGIGARDSARREPDFRCLHLDLRGQ
ncbi:MAG: hypothetical protein V4808_03400, partial [Pseudomonadota bacterium]